MILLEYKMRQVQYYKVILQYIQYMGGLLYQKLQKNIRAPLGSVKMKKIQDEGVNKIH